VLDELDYPMFIATVPGAGCLVGFATQVSIDPLRFLACLSDKNQTYRLARESSHMAVHVVPENREDLAELFGGETGDEVDKLAQIECGEGPGGVPLISGCPYLVGRIVEQLNFGDHMGFVLDVVETQGGARGIGFQRVKRIEPGHSA